MNSSSIRMIAWVFITAVASTLVMYTSISTHCSTSTAFDHSMEWLPPNRSEYHAHTTTNGATMETDGHSENNIYQTLQQKSDRAEKNQLQTFSFNDVFEVHNGNNKNGEILQHDKPPSEETWLLQTTHHDTTPSTNLKIPKIINKMYFQKNGHFQHINQTAAFDNLKEAHKSWTNMNPGYTVRYFNLQSARKYLQEYFHPVFLRTFDCIEAFAGKSDFFRMALLYREGGWHSDWKQECLRPNLLDRISEETDVFITMDIALRNTRGNGCMQTAFLGVIPKHPVMAKYLEITMQHVHDNYYDGFDLFATGPCALGLAAKEEAKQHDDRQGRLERMTSLGEFYCDEKRITCHYYWKEEQIVLHKCEDCGVSQDWESGNNYKTLFKARNFYCEDAASIFANE